MISVSELRWNALINYLWVIEFLRIGVELYIACTLDRKSFPSGGTYKNIQDKLGIIYLEPCIHCKSTKFHMLLNFEVRHQLNMVTWVWGQKWPIWVLRNRSTGPDLESVQRQIIMILTPSWSISKQHDLLTLISLTEYQWNKYFFVGV